MPMPQPKKTAAPANPTVTGVSFDTRLHEHHWHSEFDETNVVVREETWVGDLVYYSGDGKVAARLSHVEGNPWPHPADMAVVEIPIAAIKELLAQVDRDA